MKVIMVMVMTIDGKIARNDHQFVDWSSREDKKSFFDATKQAGVLILGHNTFKTFDTPLPGRLHVVITSKDMHDKSIPGSVEYTTKSPQEIVDDLEQRGYKEAALTGGAHVNALFLKANLVDEIWLTIEPLVFGEGLGLFSGGEFNVRGRLLEVTRLNDKGTLHLKYSLRDE
nr:RibD C-terminal domain protein [uncultured bacterium]